MRTEVKWVAASIVWKTRHWGSPGRAAGGVQSRFMSIKPENKKLRLVNIFCQHILFLHHTHPNETSLFCCHWGVILSHCSWQSQDIQKQMLEVTQSFKVKPQNPLLHLRLQKGEKWEWRSLLPSYLPLCFFQYQPVLTVVCVQQTRTKLLPQAAACCFTGTGMCRAPAVTPGRGV